METRIDKFGRIVIPKNIREHLGLTTGTIIQIEERNQDILLKIIVDHAPPLKISKGVTVYTGKAVDDLESVQKDERDQRFSKVTRS